MGFRDFASRLLDDAPWSPDERASYVDNVFSDLLTYRVYEPEENLYYNQDSVGFVLECPPQITFERISMLHSALTGYCPPEGTIQFISWSSPGISPILQSWKENRQVGTSLTKRMAEKRAEYLESIRFGSDHVVKCVPHNRRILICGWMDKADTEAERKLLLEFRRNIVLTFGGETQCHDLQPGRFIEFLTEVFQSRPMTAKDPVIYDEEVPINYQVPGAGLAVRRDGVELMSSPALSASCATVRLVPKEWDPRFTAMFYGAPHRMNDAPHGPVLISLVARSQPRNASLNELTVKLAKLEHARATSFGKWQPDLPEKEHEFQTLHAELERGERLFSTCMTVAAYARGDVDDSRAALAEMSKIMSGAGITLESDTFLQLPIFQSCLPFQATGVLMKDLQRTSRVKKRKAAAVASLAPLHGEWSGQQDLRSMLLVGQQGQIFGWDNYDSSGNFNVSVVGKSGAGKSVFMQELVSGIYSSGGRVLVIDDGYSFKQICETYEGSWLGIGAGGEFRLNPFSMLDTEAMEGAEYRTDSLELITRVVATMANLGEQREGRVAGVEEEFISAACGHVLDASGTEGCITDVVEILKTRVAEEPRLVDVVMKLERYARGGAYGQMFDGPANVSIDSAFTVFELSELKGHRDLEAVVLQIIMFLGTELMFKTDRATRVAILIDEAWDLLHGFGTSSFLEGVVRRARKYTGSLITGTQSLADYFKNPGAEVCYENSDWLVMLQQKPEVIDQLVSEGRLTVTDAMASKLKILSKAPGLFSEMAIRGPEGWIFGRLLLDPFTLGVFSTKGSTVQRLKELREVNGLSMEDALEALVKEGGAV